MAKLINISAEDKKFVYRSDLRSFWAFLAAAPSVNQAKPFAWALKPGLDIWYKDDPERENEILVEHATTFFNDHATGFCIVHGMTLALEKERALTGKVGSETIQSLKASLMGPTAGIFDSLFYNCFRVVCSGIAIGLARNGSAAGALFFAIVYSGLNLFAQWYGYLLGYSLGSSLIEKVLESGIVPLFTRAASVLGAIMVGAMIPSNVRTKLAWVINTKSGVTFDVQNFLDGILPGCVGLAIFSAVLFALRKGCKPMNVIWVIMAACILACRVGIL